MDELEHVAVNVAEASGSRDRGQAPAEVGVAAATADRCGIQLGEPGVRGIVRMAVGTGHVDVLDHDPPARPGKLPHPGQDTLGLAEVGEQEPGVDQVERPAVEPVRVGDVIFDVADTSVPRVLAGQLNDLRIEVDPGDESAVADDAGHVQRDVATPATQVQAPIAGAQPGTLQQPERSGLEDLREQVQPPLTLFTIGDGV
jgi:hypothetical protein